MHRGDSIDRSIAYLLLRAVLGVNITMHGVSRLIAGPSTFANTMAHQFMTTPLPLWSVHLFALCLPWAEALVGLAVLFGVATRLALIVGVLELVLLTLGSTLRQDWDAAGLQLTYALVYAVLLAALEYNNYSIDARFGPKSSAVTSKSGYSASSGEPTSLEGDREA